jgi:hypothetical protein
LPPASACRALLAYRSGGDVGRMAAPMDAPPMDAAPLTEAVA